MARRRIPDSKKCKGSSLVPFNPYELPEERHARRLSHALSFQQEIEKRCTEFGYSVTVTNHGHHWKFTFGRKVMEWWPSSAKLVKQYQYRRGVHTFDFEQAWDQVHKYFQETT